MKGTKKSTKKKQKSLHEVNSESFKDNGIGRKVGLVLQSGGDEMIAIFIT